MEAKMTRRVKMVVIYANKITNITLCPTHRVTIYRCCTRNTEIIMRKSRVIAFDFVAFLQSSNRLYSSVTSSHFKIT